MYIYICLFIWTDINSKNIMISFFNKIKYKQDYKGSIDRW